jgi:hypothetical protein
MTEGFAVVLKQLKKKEGLITQQLTWKKNK